jgi:hypothetical protein
LVSLAASVVLAGAILTVPPAQAQAIDGSGVTGAAASQGDEAAYDRYVTYGPYATWRRANEVANYFRGLGYYAIAFHNGDGYYARIFAR